MQDFCTFICGILLIATIEFISSVNSIKHIARKSSCKVAHNCPYPQDPCEDHCQQSSSSMIRLISSLSILHDVYWSVYNI